MSPTRFSPLIKVPNDLDKYLLKHSIIKDCLESDVDTSYNVTDFINFD